MELCAGDPRRIRWWDGKDCGCGTVVDVACKIASVGTGDQDIGIRG